MKIALMLCGQGRLSEEKYNITKKGLLDRYDVDVYCQLVWDENIKKRGTYIGGKKIFSALENTPELITELYKPKKLLISEDYDSEDDKWGGFLNKFPQFEKFKNGFGNASYFTIAQFKGIWEVSNLLDWNEYDYVIKCRYDSGIEQVPNFESLNPSSFYAAHDPHGTFQNQPDFFCDSVYIMNKNHFELTKIFEFLQENNMSENYFAVEAEKVYNYYLHKLKLVEHLVKLPLSEFRVL